MSQRGPKRVKFTISELLAVFLADQRERLSMRTFHQYEEVIRCFRDYLNNHGDGTLNKNERQRWQEVSESGEHEAFCNLFGPRHIVANAGSFLGTWVPDSGIQSPDLLKAMGTVTGKLARWMADHEFVSRESVKDVAVRARDWSRSMTAGNRFRILVDRAIDKSLELRIWSGDVGAQQRQDWVFLIEGAEDGQMWLRRWLEPRCERVSVAISQKACDLFVEASILIEEFDPCMNWAVGADIALIKGKWELISIGYMFPEWRTAHTPDLD